MIFEEEKQEEGVLVVERSMERLGAGESLADEMIYSLGYYTPC